MGKATISSNDGLQSFVSGLGDPQYDKAASATYFKYERSDAELLAAYETSWIAQKIVDIPAQDAFREWRNWQAPAEQITKIEETETRLGLIGKLGECMIAARLLGGAAIYIGTDQDAATPFDPATIGRDGVKYLTVLTRRELTAGELETDPASEHYGTPREYRMAVGLTTTTVVHPSRLVILYGKRHVMPFDASGLCRGWGRSCLQSTFDAVRNADSVAANIASLIFEANVDVFGVPDLMQSLSDPAYEKRLHTRMSLASAGKSIHRALIMDANETHDRKAASFTQLPELMESFLLMVSGAADIPLTRFIGQTPSGLSSTGTGDMKNYHDHIASLQALTVTPALRRLDEALIRSALGSKPADVWYEWAPLEQLNEKETTELGERIAKTSEMLSRIGLFTPDELRAATTNALVEHGVYPGLGELVAETDASGGFDLGEPEPEPEPDPTEPDPTEPDPTEPDPEKKPAKVDDAAPRTLYVSRPVLNADEIIGWAHGQGLTALYPAAALHVTLAYSRAPVDWMRVGQPWEGQTVVEPGGPRLLEVMGGGVVALLFRSFDLEARHARIHDDTGAVWDWPEYQPHVTIAFGAPEGGLANVEPYQGRIILGPEKFQPINDDWRA